MDEKENKVEEDVAAIEKIAVDVEAQQLAEDFKSFLTVDVSKQVHF